MARQKLYKKLSVLFYDKDKEIIDGLERLSVKKDDNMSRYVKRMIIEELKKQEK